MKQMICGQCKCYSAFNYRATTGRCRRYQKVMHCLSKCLEESYICDCQVIECLEKR